MSDSLRTSLLRMVAGAFPQLVYGHPRTYIVATVDADGRLDLVPPPDAAHLPELRKVEQWNTGGAIVTPELGAEVVVVFRDANPGRPTLVAWAPQAPTEPGGAAGTRLEELMLSRESDSVLVGEDLGRVLRFGDIIMMPVAPGAVPTATPIVGSAPGATTLPTSPVTVSRVKA